MKSFSFRTINLLGAITAFVVGAIFLQGNRLQAQDAAATGQSAPAWKLLDLDGHEVSSEQFKGKVVIVDFWATWCGPCVGEIPNYVALQNKYGKDGLVIIGALTHDPKKPSVIKDFAQKHGMNYTIVISNEATEEAFGGFEAIPTTFLINRQGRIVHHKTGALPPEEYEKIVQQALN